MLTARNTDIIRDARGETHTNDINNTLNQAPVKSEVKVRC
jgi:hypothetical protein